MRYIRTKDGIYKIDHINGFGIVFIHHHRLNMVYELSIKDSATGKQADTIEELFDEFVCFENKMTFHNLETITSSCNLKHLTIYGAIWTDKGLIYVAKMNDKGELELC